MRRLLFPLLILLLVLFAVALVWAWSTDAVLKAKCTHAGGHWDAAARSCMLDVTPPRS